MTQTAGATLELAGAILAVQPELIPEPPLHRARQCVGGAEEVMADSRVREAYFGSEKVEEVMVHA